MSDATTLRRRGFLLVFVATFLWSLAGLFARMVPNLDIGAVLFGRAAIGGGCGVLLAVHDWRSARLDARALWTPMAPLVILLSATAISAYVAAVKTTTVADVLVIYATLPFLAAGMAFALTGERASRRTLIAAGVAMIGMVVMVAGGLGQGRLLGQAFALLMTVTFAGLVVVQRRDAALPVAPINALAALVAAGFGFSVSGSVAVSPYQLGVLFLFGVTTITIAFAMFMEGAKHVPSAEAALIAMLDVVVGPLLVLLAFGERPDRATLVGGAFVLAAALWRLAPELRRRSGTVTPAATPL
jgi:drug/metabolite transporter (DMT)-like permease